LRGPSFSYYGETTQTMPEQFTQTEEAANSIKQKTYLDTLKISQGDKATLIEYLNRIVSNKQCNDTVLVIHGESGSGKTIMNRVLKHLFSDHWIPYQTFDKIEYEKIKSTKVRVAFIEQSQLGGEERGVFKDLARDVFLIMFRDVELDASSNEGLQRNLHQIELRRFNPEQQSVFQWSDIKRLADELLNEIK